MKRLIENPPEGYEFIVNENKSKSKLIKKAKDNGLTRFLYKSIIKKTFNVLNFANKLAYHESPEEADLILTTGQIVNEKKPWIVKILDSPFILGANDYKVFMKNKEKISKALASEYCKKIIVHTHIAEKMMRRYFPIEVTKKIEILTPAMPTKVEEKIKHDSLNLLFIGSINNPHEFTMKGGIQVIKTFKELKKKYPNVKLTIKCKVPDEVKKEYDLNDITLIEDIIPYEDVKKLYKESDLLLMLGYGGYMIMSYLEAFSYGLPIIALDTFGVSDFIVDGKTGFKIKPSKNVPINNPAYPSISNTDKFLETTKIDDKELTNESVEKISKLIDDKELLNSISKECQRLSQEKYSFDKKRERLKNIFDEALKNV
jgi:glycosyltransferase involved in cell wall biosynthesis